MPHLVRILSLFFTASRREKWGTLVVFSFNTKNNVGCIYTPEMWATQYKRAPLSRYAGCVFAKKPTASRKGDTLMKSTIKYVGMDVHQSTISVAVLDAEGKRVMQSILATHAAAILDFIHGVRGTLQVTFEEGTQSAWLYDLLVRHVAKVVVCNPRKNALLKAGNKSDQIDARKLAELLRADLLSPVYHGENSCRILQEF